MAYTPPPGNNINFNLSDPAGGGYTPPLNFDSSSGLEFSGLASAQGLLDYSVIISVAFADEASTEFTPLVIVRAISFAPLEASTETEFTYSYETPIIFAAEASTELTSPDVNFLLYFIGEASSDQLLDYTVSFHIDLQSVQVSTEIDPPVIYLADVTVWFRDEAGAEGTLSVYLPPTKSHEAVYGLLVEQSHVSGYIIAQKVEKDFEARYGLLVESDHEGTYSIYDYDLVSTGHEAVYLVYEDKEKRHEGHYYLLTSDGVEAYHTAHYILGAEGIVGITERSAFSERPWGTYAGDRDAWLHLFNTHLDDRNATYERFYESSSWRWGVVVRELILSERDGIYALWWTEENERSGIHGLGYEEHETIRDGIYERYFTEESSRDGHVAISLPDERKAVWWSCWNSLRYGTLKFWWFDERRAWTFGRPIPPSASQRYGYIQLDRTKFDSTRQACTDAYCAKVSCVINPLWRECQTITVSNVWKIVFENRVVVDESFDFCPVPIDINLPKDVSLLLLYKEGPDCSTAKVINLGTKSFLYLPLQSFTGGTYRFEGWLFPTRHVLFLEARPHFSSYAPFHSDGEFFKDLQRHGYYTVRIGGQEMEWYGRKQISIGGFSFPLKVEVLISNVLFARGITPGIDLVWAYPERKQSAYKTLLRFASPF